MSRRFASDDSSSPDSADNEHQSIKSAVESATDSASTYASDAAESVSSTAQSAKDSFSDAVGGAAGYAFGAPEGRSVDGDRPRRSFDRAAGGDRRSRGSAGATDGYNRKLTPTPGIYIGNLLFDVTDADLRREFQEFGPIKSATVAVDARGLSKG